jgi:hypothetical protein
MNTLVGTLGNISTTLHSEDFYRSQYAMALTKCYGSAEPEEWKTLEGNCRTDLVVTTGSEEVLLVIKTETVLNLPIEFQQLIYFRTQKIKGAVCVYGGGGGGGYHFKNGMVYQF